MKYGYSTATGTAMRAVTPLEVLYRSIAIRTRVEDCPFVQEAIETVKQSIGTELVFDVFVVLDSREVRLFMERCELQT